jgi:LAS superfamily LD-carboxypeptidase LdcB
MFCFNSTKINALQSQLTKLFVVQVLILYDAISSLSCDILKCDIYADYKELKRQRERERYANNKCEILKRRRELQELKKQPIATENQENLPCCTQATRISGVTQIQNIATQEGHVFYTSNIYVPCYLKKADFVATNTYRYAATCAALCISSCR